MIEFNVTPSRVNGHPPHEPLIDRTSRWWTCADRRIDEYGDVALAVEHNVVSGVFLIGGYHRDPAAGNKVVLELSDPPSTHPALAWLGLPAPVPWEPGQRQPFKYVSWRGLVPSPSGKGV
jgi:hypothetical protein